MGKEKKTKRQGNSPNHGRGFKRTKKQWENSFADHVGKFIDRLSMRDVLYGLTFLGTAFTVHQFLPKAPSIYPPDKWQIGPFVYVDRPVAEVAWIAESMAAAYMLLKLDVDDIVSAANIGARVAGAVVGL